MLGGSGRRRHIARHDATAGPQARGKYFIFVYPSPTVLLVQREGGIRQRRDGAVVL